MSESHPLAIGVRAAKSLSVPAGLLFFAAATLVAGYYTVPAMHTAMDSVSAVKHALGSGFSFLSTMLLAGLTPWLFRMALPALRPARPLPELVFALVWWGVMGLVLDGFYRLLGHLFDGRGWPVAAVVLAKVAVDMGVFTPLYASPANALSHLWKDLGFSFPALRARFGRGWYRRLVLPNLIPNYIVWVPGVTLVYAMPGPLQLPMSNLLGCFWALMCLQLATRTAESGESAAPVDEAACEIVT